MNVKMIKSIQKFQSEGVKNLEKIMVDYSVDMTKIAEMIDKYDSYAIFATHSPIILQELPSKNIQILEKIDNTVAARNPLIECFGDNISQIISDVFDVTETESYHKQVLKRLSKEVSEEDVYELFSGHLSLDAKIYLKTLYRGNHND